MSATDTGLWRCLRRAAVYVWVAPGTALGVAATLLALAQGGRGRWVDGVFEVTGPRLLAWLSRGAPVDGGIGAITLGHIVIGVSEAALNETRLHERVHVRQYERWGLFFVPAYLIASGWQWLRGRHPYRDNPFEVEAYRAEQSPAGASSKAGLSSAKPLD